MTELKLEKYITITGILRCRTGLRIGGSKEELEIGGMDNPILRDPVDKLPYIPGSSLKGKLRALLEYKYDRVGWRRDSQDPKSGEPCGCGKPLRDCPVCTIFGPHKYPGHELGPSRIIVRDAILTERSRQELDKLASEGLQFAEIKPENIINRRTGTAGDPRFMERVPKGTEFQLNITLRVFKNDDRDRMKEIVMEAIDLVSKDYLGGSGTRGYGWVEIKDVKVSDL